MLVVYFDIIFISFLMVIVSCKYDLEYGISTGRGEITTLPVKITQSPRRKRSKGRFDFNRLHGAWRYSKEEIKEIFEEYYRCLDNYMKRENRITEAITAILALEGQRVELRCPICVRPDQKTKVTRLFWQRVRNADATTSHINSKTKGVQIKRDMTLLFKKIDVTDAGQYYCVNDGDFEVIYQVDVLFSEPHRSVSENNTSSLLPAQKLVDHNIKVFTHWSEWGDCDQCDRNGRRLKFGTCMVEKIDLNKPITPFDIPVMTLYPHGYCYRHCPTTPPPIVVTDENGDLVEIIEGGYHPINKKPDLPPIVKRDVKHHPVGTDIKLTCPTSEKGKVRWQRGDRPINPATIRHQTKGRVFVDKLNRLHIRKFRIRDSAPYSCWTWRTHIGTFKIIGFEPMNEDIKHYITYGGLLITIIGIPLYCICKICFGKPKRRRR